MTDENKFCYQSNGYFCLEVPNVQYLAYSNYVGVWGNDDYPHLSWWEYLNLFSIQTVSSCGSVPVWLQWTIDSQSLKLQILKLWSINCKNSCKPSPDWTVIEGRQGGNRSTFLLSGRQLFMCASSIEIVIWIFYRYARDDDDDFVCLMAQC